MKDILQRMSLVAGLLTVLSSCSGSSDNTDTVVTDSTSETDAPTDSRQDNLVSNDSLDTTSNDQADDSRHPLEYEMALDINQAPLAVKFSYQDKALVELASDDQSALALLKPDGQRLTLQGEPQVEELGPTTRLTYTLTDGREATVTIEPDQQGGARVSFNVPQRQEFERLLADFAVTENEGFYGIMERVVQGPQDNTWKEGITQGLNLRGQELELLVLPTISIYSPFFVSSKGYGVLVDSDWPGRYDFGKQNPKAVKLNYEGDVLSFVVFPGPSPLQAVERYSRFIGTTMLPPKYTFGHFRWRDDHYNLPYFYDGTAYNGPFNTMVVEDILMMEAFGIPVSVYWVDRPWGPGDFGYDDFKYDTNRLPHPVEMISWLKDRGVRFMLWIAPWAVGEMADVARAKGYSYDNPMPFAGPEDAELLDFTNPEAVTWWQDAMMPLMEDGVIGFKLDRGEEKNPEGLLFKGTVFDGRSYREIHNAYVYLYAKTVNEAFQRFGSQDYIVMPRAAWKGSSHYATPWGGDTAPTEWGLRSAIIALQRCASMNFPIWGSDTCGYGWTSTQEVCSRWLAFSAFTPIMEVGPTGNVAFWSWPADGVDADVNENGYHFEHNYNEQLIAEWILYSNIHQDLMDYSYEHARISHETGTPIVKPMYFLDPENQDYLDRFDQYLYGDDILVAPVWKSGTTTRDVLLPSGPWVDAWTGEEHTGPKSISVDVPEHKIPIFVRKGSSVALGNLEQRWSEAQATAAQKPDLAEMVKSLPEF